MQLTPRTAVAATLGVIAAAVLLALAALAPWSGDSSADAILQGDTDCSGDIEPTDALWVLRAIADAPPLPECVDEAGDVDCSGAIEEADVTGILFYSVTGEQKNPQGNGCPAIGDPLDDPGAPTGTSTLPPTSAAATNSNSPTPTATPTVTAEPSVTATQGPVVADSYSGATLLGTGYLGSAAGAMIEYARIPGRPNEALVARQSGEIYRVALDQSFEPELWGDVSGLMDNDLGTEEGLLALAFSPDFESDGRVYMYYTPGCGNPCQPTVLARFNATPEDLDEGSRDPVIEIDDFAGNHNGGHIAFDSEGYLYLSLGDGGGSGDPEETAQDLTDLRGKVLRLDASGESGYTIPPGNPFADGPNGNRDEIFAYGFRNPFRMTIDPTTDDVWLGDVGQNEWEEVDLVVAGGNYGWDCREGNHVFDNDGCPASGFIAPRAEHDHGNGRQAITGGVVYRGTDLPELYGWYVYGDFYSGEIFALDTETNDPPVRLFDSDLNIAAFTLLPDGEVAIVTYSDGVLRLAD